MTEEKEKRDLLGGRKERTDEYEGSNWKCVMDRDVITQRRRRRRERR